MTKLSYTPKARADLVAIRLYSIEQFGADVADEYFLGFDAAFDRLEEYPQSGQAKPEYGKDIRGLVHRQHRVLYTATENHVLIVRIIHHARDARQALKGTAG